MQQSSLTVRHYLGFSLYDVKPYLIFIFALAVFSFYSSGRVVAQKSRVENHEKLTETGKRIYQTQHINSSPPRIDGILDDESWQEGYWSGNYRQYLPAEGADPSELTELKILYDDDNLYMAIRAHDAHPDKIDRQMGRRDEFTGDIVGICFDSYFDHRTGFEFDLTAAGSKIDLILMNQGWDTNWDAVWYGKVGLEDSAWIAEFQVPLSQLRYGKNEKQIWGLHAWRWINRNQEEDQWALQPRDNLMPLYYIGELHGIEGISRKRRIELLPYSVGKMITKEADPADPYAKNNTFEASAGLDGKIGLTSDFTLDFTVNPDFGQVEADPSVLNLTAFETFYEEKRPFFLEGKNILDFDFGQDLLFYSRRIGHSPLKYPDLDDNEYAQHIENTRILGALKLTGKTRKGLSVGVMESLTEREKIKITSGDAEHEEIVEPLTNYMVARVQKDIHEGNTIVGGMITNTNRWLDDTYLNDLNRNALTGGFDLRHHWNDRIYFVDIKGVFSDIKGSPAAMENLMTSSARYYQRPDEDYLDFDTSKSHLSGLGGSFRIGKRAGGHWRYSTGFDIRSPGLDLNDMGYMQIADAINHDISLGYVENEPKGVFRNYNISANYSNSWNFGGDKLESQVSMSTNFSFSNKWSINGSTLYRFGSLDQRLLRGGPAVHLPGFLHNRYTISTDVSRKLAFRAGAHIHKFKDPVNKMNEYFCGTTLKIGNALQISGDMDYTADRDHYQYVDEFDIENSQRYLLATLDRKTIGLTVRADFAITPEFTIQYYGNPYISVGNYYDFKKVVDPAATEHDEIYYLYKADEMIYDETLETYTIDENLPGGSTFSFENPDFNFRQFRSNLVARWEYKPGSTLFLVWTHGRSDYVFSEDFTLHHSISRLFDIPAENVFLIKLNYWFQI